jgi:hypothetical protein
LVFRSVVTGRETPSVDFLGSKNLLERLVKGAVFSSGEAGDDDVEVDRCRVLLTWPFCSGLADIEGTRMEGFETSQSRVSQVGTFG